MPAREAEVSARRRLDRRSTSSGSRAATTRCSRRSSAYNEEDCLSTCLLREWLLERRAEAEAQYGREIAWREPEPLREIKRGGGGGARRARAAARRAARRLADDDERGRALARGAPARVPPARGEAGLVGVLPRLEQTSPRSSSTTPSRSAGSSRTAPSRSAGKKSLVYTFTFPAQQHKLERRRRGRRSRRPGRAPGRSSSSTTSRLAALARGPSARGRPLPRALIPGGAVGHEAPARGAHAARRAVATATALRGARGRPAARAAARPARASSRRPTRRDEAARRSASTGATSSSRGRPARARRRRARG